MGHTPRRRSSLPAISHRVPALAWRAGTTAALVLVLALATGCGRGPSEDSKVFRHSLDGAPTNLDPLQSATIYANFVVLNVYDTLYSYKYLARPYELKPNLAAAMPSISEDNLTYTIPLRQGVRFIDDPVFPNGEGREVVAEDVVYSLKRHFDPDNISQGAWLWEGYIEGMAEWAAAGADYDAPVRGLRALDRHTVEITLTRAFPQLTFTLAMGFAAVVPREAVETYGRELSVKPVGSGPFKMVRFNTAKAVMEPNPNYRQIPIDLAAEGFDPARHGGLGLEAIDGRSPPLLDRLEIDFVQENAARWNSFTKGNEIQGIRVPSEQVDSIVTSKDPITLKPDIAERYHMVSGFEAGFVRTDLNMDNPALGHADDPARAQRNRALRCALRAGFSWAERNARFSNDIGQIFPGVIPPVVPEYDPEAARESVVQNRERARQLLADNGWTAATLPELSYGFSTGVTQRQLYEQFRGFMVEIGYPSEKIRAETFATFGDFNRAVKQRRVDIIGMGWGLDYPDAQNLLQLYYGPYASPGSNSSNYANPEYDALYEQAASMQPSAERTQLYRRMNQMLIDDCVTISGLSRKLILLWHKDIVAYLDRDIVGGFFLKYVDTVDAAAD